MIKLIFIVAGIIFVVSRLFVRFANKMSQNVSIDQVIDNPRKATEYLSHLDIMIERKPDINQEQFDLVKSKIRSGRFIGNYEILHAQDVNDRQFLFFTELSYDDFDVSINGRPSDVKKKAHHNFYIQLNQENNELELYSNVPSDAVDKFQKKEFLTALYQTAANETKDASIEVLGKRSSF